MVQGQATPRPAAHTMGCRSVFLQLLVGLVGKASAFGGAHLAFNFRLRRADFSLRRADFSLRRADFSGSSHTSNLNIDTPVATLPGAWRYRVSARTGWRGVSILSLGEVERLICNIYLSVAACTIV